MTKQDQPTENYPTIQEVLDQQNSEKVNSWISPELKRALEAKLAPHGGTMSGLIRYLLEQYANS